MLEFPDVRVELDLVVVPSKNCNYDVVLGENIYDFNVMLVKDKDSQITLPKIGINVVSALPIGDEVVTDLSSSDKKRLQSIIAEFSHMITKGNRVQTVKTGELSITLRENTII
ncbi:hypothetical protein Zmor_000641 [Zophobas morio]|uniref:Uncharacterized protein n=1 Tax=Zophobas morio TaxID=2755281 RepID=A0AA38IXC3_9CUCU|nr:hypothetical protein Zmor_000641 [Zophobas morio]